MSRDRTHLRKDRSANLAVLAGFGTGVALTVAAISRIVRPGFVEQRSDPVYWLLMVPLIVWVVSAAEWRPWALRLLPVILIASPIATALIAGIAASLPLGVLAAISVALSALGLRWRGRSGLRG